MTTILQPKDRDEWLKIRHGYVSSTESAALFGLSPYLTAFELALQKSDKIVSDFQGNERTAWGTRLEDAIAQGIGEDYGVLVRKQSGYAVHPDARMGSSFDYEIVGVAQSRRFLGDQSLREQFEKHGPGVLEIKNVDSLVYKNDWSEEAPAHIEIQVQHQLECIRYPWAVIGVLVGGNRNEILIRERDEDVGRVLKSKISRFWSNLADGKTPPPTMPEDASVLIRLYNLAEPGKLYQGQDDAELAEFCAEYVKQGQIEKLAEEAKEVAKAKILQRIRTAEKAIVPGFNVSTWTVAETPITYVREAYRGFRVTAKKPPKENKK